MIDMIGTLEKLAVRRPIFHSEADLQHELALELSGVDPERQCRLEVPLFPGRNGALDLAVRSKAKVFGIEIKYLTRGFAVEHGDEPFRLKQQGAQDTRRYDTLKDIQRIEELLAHQLIESGGVLCITNDPAYWQGPGRPGTCDEQFSIREGRALQGKMCWSDKTGAGTQKGRETPITLAGGYSARWCRYSQIDGQEFRYLWLPVTAAGAIPVRDAPDVPPTVNAAESKPKQTHAERILGYLVTKNVDTCDDCLSKVLAILPRQTVNQNCRGLEKEQRLRRVSSVCGRCHSPKMVNAAL